MATKNTDPTHAQRLEQVVKSSGIGFYTFAKKIGIKGQTLYQIRRGNNRISRTVAAQIHSHYPEYSMQWLMFGITDGEVLSNENLQIVRIPICSDLNLLINHKIETSNESIFLSSAVTYNAEVAVPYTDDMLNPYLRNSLLLLRQCRGQIIFGNMYLIVTEQTNLFRIVQKDSHDADNFCLVAPFPMTFDNIVISKNQIVSMWVVCGAICKMER